MPIWRPSGLDQFSGTCSVPHSTLPMSGVTTGVSNKVNWAQSNVVELLIERKFPGFAEQLPFASPRP